MGEDLSVTIRILPEVKCLVIIPDVVYYYRVGGGTSMFMPYMMDDFVTLYRYKREYARRYPISRDADYFMDVELLNITKTHFLQLVKSGRYSEIQLNNEIRKVCAIEEVCRAAEKLKDLQENISPYADLVFSIDTKAIKAEIQKSIDNHKWKDKVKSILQKL